MESDCLQILIGDIGGTNTRLAIASVRNTQIDIDQHTIYASPDFKALEDILRQYPPTSQGLASAAAFGVAGPVRDGVSRITNLPWEVSSRALSASLALERVYVLNDLEAMAWGIDTLEPAELVCLQAGHGEAPGNRAVVAAGTGLGQAGVYLDGRGHWPFATEGGHCDFAPKTGRDQRLLAHLQARYGHVSWERLVSGPGLENIFGFLLAERALPTPGWLSETPEDDHAEQISRRALAESDEHCVEALHWFVELYGREAGNVALKMNAAGGVYLGGGIAPKILPALGDGRFLEAFLDKGRMRPLLEAMSVQVIDSKLVSLKGLARYTVLRAGEAALT